MKPQSLPQSLTASVSPSRKGGWQMGGGGGMGTGPEFTLWQSCLKPISCIHKNLGKRQINGGWREFDSTDALLFHVL